LNRFIYVTAQVCNITDGFVFVFCVLCDVHLMVGQFLRNLLSHWWLSDLRERHVSVN